MIGKEEKSEQKRVGWNRKEYKYLKLSRREQADCGGGGGNSREQKGRRRETKDARGVRRKYRRMKEGHER